MTDEETKTQVDDGASRPTPDMDQPIRLDMADDLDAEQTLRKVVFNNGVWMVTVDGESAPVSDDLCGIIMGIIPARACYAGEYEPGQQPEVFCASTDGREGFREGGTVHKCATCRDNMFGSAPKGRGKRCKEYRVLLVHMDMDGSKFPVWFQVPPSKLGDWRKVRREMKRNGSSMVGAWLTVRTDGFEVMPGDDGLAHELESMAFAMVGNRTAEALLPGAEDGDFPF